MELPDKETPMENLPNEVSADTSVPCLFASSSAIAPPSCVATSAGSNNEAQNSLSGAAVVIRMRGLPCDCTAAQIIEFFKAGGDDNAVDVFDGEGGIFIVQAADGRATTDAFVFLSSEEDAVKALSKQDSIGLRYIEHLRGTEAEVKQAVPQISRASNAVQLLLRNWPWPANKASISTNKQLAGKPAATKHANPLSKAATTKETTKGDSSSDSSDDKADAVPPQKRLKAPVAVTSKPLAASAPVSKLQPTAVFGRNTETPANVASGTALQDSSSSSSPTHSSGADAEVQNFLAKGAAAIMRLHGLPIDCTASQINMFPNFIRLAFNQHIMVEFFNAGEGNAVDVLDGEGGILFVNRADGKAPRDAFVLVSSNEDVVKVLSKHKGQIGGRRIKVFRATTSDVYKKQVLTTLVLGNFPRNQKTITFSDVRQAFEPFGGVLDVSRDTQRAYVVVSENVASEVTSQNPFQFVVKEHALTITLLTY